MRIKKADYLNGYKLKILFSNNQEKIVDLEKELYGPIYEPLKDIKYFKKVFVDSDLITVQWPNGEDFSPNLLYEMGIEVKECQQPMQKSAHIHRKNKSSTV
jgi:hypothetical protein